MALILAMGMPARAVASSVCPWLTGTLGPNYRDLIKRQTDRRALIQRDAVRQLLRLRPPQCSTTEGELKATEVFRQAVENHSGKIGVILPLTGRGAQRGLAFRRGIETALGAESTSRIIFKDSTSSATVAERQFAELVFIENVAIVLAGGGAEELDRLVPWADGLMIPLLLLGSDKISLQGSHFAFRVFPSEQRLGAALAAAAQQRGFKRIAVLRPNQGESDRLIRRFVESAKQRGLEMQPAVSYQSGNASSLDLAVRTLFQIDPKARAAEVTQMTPEAEHRARDRGLAFDPRSVILKPIVQIDALFVPDHFRTLRHLSKILAYHGVPRLPLMGSQNWRTSALLEPHDPMLNGSLFVDFMGSYQALPEAIRVKGEGFFAEPSLAEAADFAAIGFRAARIADTASVAGDSRRNIPEALKRLSDLDAGLYGPGPVFDDNHHTRWPTFLFTIGTDKLDVMPLTVTD